MEKVIFVCLGNICRSPLAEGIMNKILKKEGLDDKVAIDSAGTGSWHIGELPDDRTYKIAEENAIELNNPARQVTVNDLEQFDYIIAMDENNLGSLYDMDPEMKYAHKFYLLRDFDRLAKDDKNVPDPYWGDEEEFQEIFKILERSLHEYVRFLKQQVGNNS